MTDPGVIVLGEVAAGRLLAGKTPPPTRAGSRACRRTPPYYSSSSPGWQGAGLYFIQARLRDGSTGAQSDWSPPVQITVSPGNWRWRIRGVVSVAEARSVA